jgi:hypothetical protein
VLPTLACQHVPPVVCRVTRTVADQLLGPVCLHGFTTAAVALQKPNTNSLQHLFMLCAVLRCSRAAGYDILRGSSALAWQRLRQLKLKSRLLRWQRLRQLELNFQAAEAPAASTAVASRTAGSPVLDVIGPVPGEAALGQDHVDDSE